MDTHQNLVEMLEALRYVSDKGITHISGDDEEIYVSYKDLYNNALNILYNLQSIGMQKGDELIFQINDNVTYLNVFWGCLLGGIIPIPISVGNNDEHRAKVLKIWTVLNNPYIVIEEKTFFNLGKLAQSIGKQDLFEVIEKKKIYIEEIFKLEGNGRVYNPKSEDIAFVQFSSGSTGDPKGVILTHENLVTNIDGMTYSSNTNKDDSFLSWVPLTHDLGMIGYHLWPVYLGVNHFILTTTLFIRRPTIWMKKAHQHKATILSSPNFGYSFFLNHFDPYKGLDWDLSNIRIIFNGAEPISVELCDKFLNTLKEFGLKREAMLTAYGLAEASLGVAFPEIGKAYQKISVNRCSLNIGQIVEEADGVTGNDIIEFAVEGYPIKHCSIRICDEAHNELNKMTVGYVHIGGKNVTQGYYNNKEATDSLITSDGWVNTGDLGFINTKGQLIITGRAKDIIFIRGQNYYPHDLERLAFDVEGIEDGKIAVCGVYDKESFNEEIIAFVLFKKKVEEFVPIAVKVKSIINEKIGLQIKHVIPVKDIPKTTSGKVQRYKLGERFQEGSYDSSIEKLEQFFAENMEFAEKNSEKPDDSKTENSDKDALSIQNWLVEKIAVVKNLTLKQIGLEESFSSFGLDSVKIIRIASELSDWLNRDVSPTLIYDYVTIKKLSQHLAGEQPIKNHQANVQEQPDPSEVLEGIAIVGIGCRFPKASNPEEFWSLLVEGTNAVTKIPEDRNLYSSENLSSVEWPKWGGFIDKVDEFDPLFFGISPREAENMDPQQRILLEVCWEAFEYAGINPTNLRGTSTGVFIGVSNSEYLRIQETSPEVVNAYYGTGNAFSINANRISYLFDFQGPSIVVDTACSSSLVAVHQACRSLSEGECELAVAGGVNLILTSDLNIAFNKAGMLSKDGKCKTFDKAADGYVRGEGCGVVILKPLHKALQDKDTIYAVIKGSAINHNGKSSGLTVPNGIVQQDVIKKALKNAKIKPSQVGYIEAHGTGTSLGDPIEFQALKEVFSGEYKGQEKCYVGSVKTNIGHLEAAAGMAGLIKATLMLYYRKIPQNLHFKELNPLIQIENTPFQIPTNLTEWNFERGKRIAGVSSFGFGGSNAHLVLEEHTDCAANEVQLQYGPEIVILSANDKETLKKYVVRLKDNIGSIMGNQYYYGGCVQEMSLSNIAYTLQTGRVSMTERLAAIVSNIKELYELLDRYCTGEETADKLFSGSRTENNMETGHFLDNEEGKEYLRLLAKNRNYKVIAQLWVSGFNIEWELLHKGIDKRRIALPTYPFRNEKYWPQVDSTKLKQTNSEHEILLLEKVWKYSEEVISSKDTLGTIIFVVNKNSMELLQKITWTWNKNTYILNDSDSMEALGNIKFDKNTVYIDLSDISQEEVNPAQELERLELIQALIKNYPYEKLLLLHFTLGRQKPDNGKINLKGTVMAGFVRMLGAEYGKVYAKTVDLLWNDLDRLDDITYKEVRVWENISEVCYRNGRRLIPYMKISEKYTKQLLDRSVDIPRLNSGKVVVVTGGTRGIGLEIARHLVKSGVKKLILTGRQKIPDRELWQQIIASKYQNNDLVNKITQIIELEKMGAQIHVYCGSLINERELKEYFSEIRTSFGNIGGVIHCAGLAIHENPAFINKKLSNIQAVLEPKVSALEILHRVFENDCLDFFILFSSISALVPSLATGICDYSAANYYMDAFVESKAKEGFRYYKSINWTSWKHMGIGAKLTDKFMELGLLAISLDEGLKLFDKCIGTNEPQNISIIKVDRQKFGNECLLQVKRGVQPLSVETVPDIAIKTEDNQMVNCLKELFSSELKIQPDKIKEAANFDSLGFDSIILAELVKKIEERLGIVLEPSVFWEYPNIKTLATFLGDNCDAKQVLVENQSSMEKLVCQDFDEMIEYEGVSACTELGSDKYQEKSGKIAVIGVTCRFPGATDKNEFWNNLKAGKDSVVEVPSSRWDTEEYFQEGFCEGKSMSKWGGFIDDINEIDPHYFKIDKEAAKQTDPLVRLFLEAGVDVTRDAGYDRDELSGRKVGVFVGARISSYSQRIQRPTKDTIVAAGQNFIAAHLSHFMNLKGPSMVVDTACSSSLVSLHLACQSLNASETEMCIAGGVDLLLDEKTYILLSQAKALSPDGKCHTFDKNANGFVPGEGCGAVLLKPLERAVSDGDKIYAVIEATAVNNDGNTMGITTPNFEAQIEVINEAINKAGINPETVSYIEAHGTGTLIGDPIELKALTSVFQEYTQSKQYCGIGSVKTNIGHLLSAAGIAGFIKTVLSVYNKQLPPSLNCEIPNPRFDFSQSPFYIVNELKQWKPVNQVRRAGISSFGFGGTNAHVILSDLYLSEYPFYRCYRKELKPVEYTKERLWMDRPKVVDTLYPAHQRFSAIELKSRKKDSFEFGLKIGNDDYIVRDHHVHGVSIMPGVTFIDFLYRALELIGLELEKITVQNVLFKTPISTSKLFDREVTMKVSKNNQSYSVVGESRKCTVSGLLESEWEENFRCDIRLDSVQEHMHIDIDSLKQKEVQVLELDDAYRYVRAAGIEHFEFMKPSGKIYLHEDWLLAEVVLSESGKKYLPFTYFHPAFMDSASIVSFMFQYKGIASESMPPFIPIFIESFYGNAKTHEKCYIYVEKQNTDIQSEDMMYSSIAIVDANGDFIAAFDKFVAKKIRAKDLITRLDAVEFKGNMNNCSTAKLVKGEAGNLQNELDLLPQDLTEELKKMVAEVAGIPIEKVNTKESFYELGLDSTDLLEMTYRLEGKVGKTLYPTLLFEYSTIEELKRYLSDQQLDLPSKPVMDSTNQKNGLESEVMYFSYLWEKQELTENKDGENQPKVMIFDCAERISTDIVENEKLILVKPGVEFYSTNKNEYTIDYQNDKHFCRLIEEHVADGALPDIFCYLLPEYYESDLHGLEYQVDRYLKEIYPIFSLCKALYNVKSKEQLNIFTLYKTGTPGQIFYSALKGLFKGVHLENNKIWFKLIESDMDLWGRAWNKDSMPELDIVLQEAFDSMGHLEIKYSNGSRYVKVLYENSYPFDEIDSIKIRDKGVYIIAGGIGGLGLILTKHLVGLKQVKIAILGRSELTWEKKQLLGELGNNGSDVVYLKSDITNIGDVRGAVSEVLEKWGTVNGVINCAGVNYDNLIGSKSKNEIEAVMMPKIKGTVFLDEATKELELDFFILYSSLVSITGNIGQSDYAYANGFLDSFIQAREALCAEGRRKGESKSFNWSLWENGGMQVDEKIKSLFLNTYGIKTIDDKLGMEIFDKGLNSSQNQVIPVRANRQKFMKLIDISKPGENTPSVKRRSEYFNLLMELDNAVVSNVYKYNGYLDIEVIEVGTGKPLLLLSAFGMAASIWYYQIKEWKKDYRLIIIHLPGHGKSKTMKDMSLEKLSCAINYTLECMGIVEPVPMIAASFGGMLAQDFASRFSTKLSAIILVCSFSKVTEEFKSMRHSEALKVFNNAGKDSINDIKGLDTNTVDQNKLIYYGSQSMDPLAALEYLGALQQMSTRYTVKNIKKPVFVISSALDKFKGAVFGNDETDFLLGNIQDAISFVFEDSGHFPYITNYRMFNETVHKYLMEYGY